MKRIEVISQMTYNGDGSGLYKYKFAGVINGWLFHPTSSGSAKYTVDEFEKFFMSDLCSKFKLELVYD